MTDDANVTSNAITIEVANGQTANIQPDVLREYVREAYGYISEQEKAKGDLKELVETVAETTGLKKGVINKYFKARYKQATEAEKSLGKLFTQLDEALEVKKNED